MIVRNKNFFILESFTHKFTVYALEELFLNLRNINIENSSNILRYNNSIASLKFQNDPFSYNKSIQCEVSKKKE
jgi:hypothetical protein